MEKINENADTPQTKPKKKWWSFFKK